MTLREVLASAAGRTPSQGHPWPPPREPKPKKIRRVNYERLDGYGALLVVVRLWRFAPRAWGFEVRVLRHRVVLFTRAHLELTGPRRDRGD